ncbi:MAG: hypothetical protein ACJ8BW_37875 [Ktedonobacteraceae bacterium]
MNQIYQFLGMSKQMYDQSQEPHEEVREQCQGLRLALSRLLAKDPGSDFLVS